MLSGVNGSCTDISPMAMIAGGAVGNASFEKLVPCSDPCIVSNASLSKGNRSKLDCSPQNRFPLAVVARMPRYICGSWSHIFYYTQSSINVHLKGDIMVLNQRVDLFQEPVDTLWQIAQLGTSAQYQNHTQAANLSRQLSMYLTGN